MRKSIHTTVAGLTIALVAGSGALQAQTLQEASDAAGVAKLKAIEISGAGRWFQFGQAPNPDSPWPPFDVKSYVADINYDTNKATTKPVDGRHRGIVYCWRQISLYRYC